MIIRIYVDCVNGDFSTYRTTEGKQIALAWLEKNDHEGSVVNMIVYGMDDKPTLRFTNPEHIYEWLRN